MCVCVCVLQQTFLGATELDDELIKQLPKEVLLRVFSYLDVVSLCRCAQVGVTPLTPTPPPSPVACNNSTLSIKINESFFIAGVQILERACPGRFQLAENQFVRFPT